VHVRAGLPLSIHGGRSRVRLTRDPSVHCIHRDPKLLGPPRPGKPIEDAARAPDNRTIGNRRSTPHTAIQASHRRMGQTNRFNGKFSDECLSLQWFKNSVDAKILIETFRREHKEIRPHSSFGSSRQSSSSRALQQRTLQSHRRSNRGPEEDREFITP
jgi:hypothetical protein